MKTMAEVLHDHGFFDFDDESRLYRCRCGVWMSDEDVAEHQAEALEAAGYGPIREAQATAWDEGYERAESDHYGTGFWTKRLRGNPYKATL